VVEDPKAPSQPRRPRARRFLLIAAALLVLLVLLCALTPIDEAIVAGFVARGLGADVSIDSLSWFPTGHLRARGVRATLPGGREPFFGVETLDLDLDLLPPRLAAIVLVKPRLVATEREDGRLDLKQLVREGKGRPGRAPAVRVEEGELELRGDGPLRARLRELVAPDLPATLRVRRLELKPDGDAVTISGEVVPAGLAVVRVGGRASGGRLEFLAATVTGSDAVELASARALVHPDIAAWLDRNRVGGSLRGDLEVHWEEGKPKVAATLELLDVDARLEAMPWSLTGLRGRVRLKDGVARIDSVTGRHDRAAVTVRGQVADLGAQARAHVEVRVDSAVVDDELRESLARIEIGREVLAALAPEGRFSLTATVDAGGDTEPHFVLELDLDDCAGVFHGFVDPEGVRRGFPVRIERVRGHVHVAQHDLAFEGVSGFTRAGARVEASARWLGEELAGEVRVFEAPIDGELLDATEAAVGPSVRELAAKLGAAGRFDVTARFHRTGDHEPVELGLELRPRAVTLLPPAFPYALEIDGGRVTVDAHEIVLDRLHGTAGRGIVVVDGRVELPPGPPGPHAATDPPPEPAFEVTLSALGIEIDEELRRACKCLDNAVVSERIEEAAPRGELALVLSWARDRPAAPIRSTMRLEPRNVVLQIAGGAATLTRVQGSFTLSREGEGPWQVDLESDGGVRATCFEGSLLLRGRTDETGQGEVTLSGGRVRVGPELQRAIAPFSPEVAGLLASSGLDGRIRVNCKLEPRRGRLTPTRVEVEPDVSDAVGDFGEGLSLAPQWLPLGLQWLSGPIHADLDQGRMTFDRVNGLLGDARVEVEGGSLALDDAGTTVNVSLTVDALPFRQAIELALGAEKRKALLPYGPLGRTRISVHELTLRLPADGGTIESLSTSGAVDVEGWTFYTGGGLRELTGRIELLEFELARKNGDVTDVRADGRFTGVTLALGDLRLANLEGDLTLVDGRLTIPWLSADLAGGRLPREKNHVSIALTGEMPFDGRLELQSGDFSRMLGDEPTRLKGLVGRVDADVGFRGNARPLVRGAGRTGLEAGGSVSIRDAKLWSIPIFDKLYTKAVVPLVGTTEGEGGVAEPPKWNRGEIDFALQGVHVRLSKVELEGEPLVLRGEGTLGPDRLALNFYPEVRSGLRYVRDLPVLGWILDPILSLLEHEVGAFRFQGPYGSPDVEWDPVSLVPRPDLAIRFERPRTSTPRATEAPERF
jgi:hypothetical protein